METEKNKDRPVIEQKIDNANYNYEHLTDIELKLFNVISGKLDGIANRLNNADFFKNHPRPTISDKTVPSGDGPAKQSTESDDIITRFSRVNDKTERLLSKIENDTLADII